MCKRWCGIQWRGSNSGKHGAGCGTQVEVWPLEQEIGRIKQKGGKRAGGGTELSGKFVVLDLLAKGLVHIHTTSTGEQFVRLTT